MERVQIWYGGGSGVKVAGHLWGLLGGGGGIMGPETGPVAQLQTH